MRKSVSLVRWMRHQYSDLAQHVIVKLYSLKKMPPTQLAETVKDLEQRIRASIQEIDAVVNEECALAVPSLRVLVVEDDEAVRNYIADVLRDAGHDIVDTVGTGEAMVEKALELKPDIIVFDIGLPGIDGIEAIHRIQCEYTCGAVAVTGDRQIETITRAMQESVLGYLLKPVDSEQLIAAFNVAYARLQEYKELQEEKNSLKENLENRKLVERAKGILMTRYRWSEQEAFRCLQKTAMDQRFEMVEVARRVIFGKNIKLTMQ
jgi:AmiR/NasT family two-component response regulator